MKSEIIIYSFLADIWPIPFVDIRPIWNWYPTDIKIRLISNTEPTSISDQHPISHTLSQWEDTLGNPLQPWDLSCHPSPLNMITACPPTSPPLPPIYASHLLFVSFSCKEVAISGRRHVVSIRLRSGWKRSGENKRGGGRWDEAAPPPPPSRLFVPESLRLRDRHTKWGGVCSFQSIASGWIPASGSRSPPRQTPRTPPPPLMHSWKPSLAQHLQLAEETRDKHYNHPFLRPSTNCWGKRDKNTQAERKRRRSALGEATHSHTHAPWRDSRRRWESPGPSLTRGPRWCSRHFLPMWGGPTAFAWCAGWGAVRVRHMIGF